MSDEVYELLKRARMPGESFSDVIRRGLRSQRISGIIGSRTISLEGWAEAKATLDRAQKKTLAELKRKAAG